MENLSLKEKVSYLKGLVEGMELNGDLKEGKILVSIIDVLNDMADAIAKLEASQAELDEYLQVVDEDLSDLESSVYGTESVDDRRKGENTTRYIEIECPHCNETVYLDEDLLEEEENLVCPYCQNMLYIEEDENGDETESEAESENSSEN